MFTSLATYSAARFALAFAITRHSVRPLSALSRRASPVTDIDHVVLHFVSLLPSGFDGFQSASTYKAPPRIDIWEYDTPADPRFAALTPSGFGVDRPLFNPDEPPYEVERESVGRHTPGTLVRRASHFCSFSPLHGVLCHFAAWLCLVHKA